LLGRCIAINGLDTFFSRAYTEHIAKIGAGALVNIQPFAELLAGLSGSEADAVPMAG